jgi:hypothetical protein
MLRLAGAGVTLKKEAVFEAGEHAVKKIKVKIKNRFISLSSQKRTFEKLKSSRRLSGTGTF